jgi:hypothetical protein
MEKLISEFRVIETDDGFRIEITGDKQKMREFMRGHGEHRHWGPRSRHGSGWGPFAHGMSPMMWMKMASCMDAWDYETEQDEEPEGAKA